MKTIAIILAAGNGLRMQTKIPKAFLMLGGETILERSVEIFENCKEIDEIVIGVPENYTYTHNKHKIAEGGETRQESAYKALKELSDNTEIVLIHDAVRPFVSPEIIKKGVEACKKHGSAIPVIPVKNTVKKVRDGIVEETLERNGLFETQTPQIFFYDLIMKAHKKAKKDGFCGTDDAILVERMGERVTVFEGEEINFKITTQKDLFMAKEFIKKQIR